VSAHTCVIMMRSDVIDVFCGCQCVAE